MKREALADDLNAGFRVDGVLVPWGTTLGSAKAFGGLSAKKPRYAGWMSAAFRSGEMFGLKTLSATVSAPAEDRPVVSASYEIDAEHAEASAVVDRLIAVLGKPRKNVTYPDNEGIWSMVVETAEWPFGDVSVSVSVFGGEREEPGGRSIAMIWHNWSEEKAAQPFVAEWRSRNAALERYAARRSSFELFTLDLPQLAIGYEGDKEPAANKLAGIDAKRASYFALRDPEILNTPAALAKLIPVKGCALWTSTMYSVWGVSTKRNSQVFDMGSAVEAMHIEMKPAKGGGFCEIKVGRWSAQACYPSDTVARLAAIVGGISGVKVKHVEGYDA